MARRRMAERRNAHAEWRRSDRGCWSLSLGQYSRTIRITQREPGGGYFRIIADSKGRRSWKSLGTTSRTEARRLGEALLRALETAGSPAGDEAEAKASPPPPPPAPLTVGQLWTRFREECPAYRSITKHTRANYDSRGPLLVLGFGADKRVDYLTEHDVNLYIELRQRGTGWSDGRVTKAPRGKRTVQVDLKLLLQMIRWATTVREKDGSWLLAENPLRGFKVPREDNPRRPVTTFTRHLAIMTAVDGLEASAPDEEACRKWRRLRLALQISEATGRRRGSVRQLCWEDLDWARRRVRWRGEHDKKKREQYVPLPKELLEILRTAWLTAGQPSTGWVLPSPRGNKAIPGEMLDVDFRAAEVAAGLEPLAGGLWHPYRRKWMVERKEMPLKDVMDAGGWTDVQTVLTCYQHSDDDTLLAVMESPKKLVEREDGLRGLLKRS